MPAAPTWRNRWSRKQSSWGWHHYYELWCDDVRPKQTRSCSGTDTPFPDARCLIPLPAAKEKTILAWGTLLSEAFTHRSAGSFCDTTVVPQSFLHRVQWVTACPSTHDTLFVLGGLPYLCVCECRCETMIRERRKQRKQRHRKCPDPLTCHRKWFLFRQGFALQASPQAACLTKAWSIKACPNIEPSPALILTDFY